MESARTYSTSQLADAAAVGPQTLRYYERRGLLPEPPRTSGGHRIYGPEHLERLLFIQRAQSLGFDLQEIREILRLSRGDLDELDRRAALDQLVATIDAKLESLQSIRGCLDRLRFNGRERPRAGDDPVCRALLGRPS